jgi:hypothetical protein
MEGGEERANIHLRVQVMKLMGLGDAVHEEAKAVAVDCAERASREGPHPLAVVR